MGRWLILAILVVGACTKRNPGVCCTTESDCEAKGLPVGTDCGDGATCVRNGCVPNVSCQSESDCEAPTALCDLASNTCVECKTNADCDVGICNASTYACESCTTDEQCDSGFCDVGAGLCGQNLVEWKYLPTICDAAASSPLSVSGTQAVDTSNAGACTGGTFAQAAGPEICVFRATTIDVVAGAVVSYRGSRALALVADGDVTIAGTIDVGADSANAVSGPGGNYVIQPTFTEATNASDASMTARGGGGAGARTAGASGGGAVNGGVAVADITNTPLVGGAQADRRLALPGVGGYVNGGFGGGGMTLISCNGTLRVTGTVHAGGGGGAAAGSVIQTAAGNYASGGFGGGAGGTVVFQARAIELTGSFYANGGGGGTGRFNSASFPGKSSTLADPCPSAVEIVSMQPVGRGGKGGCGATPPTAGETGGPSSSDTHGGGGGSVGFFRTVMPTGVPVVTPTIAQPAFEPNETVPRH